MTRRFSEAERADIWDALERGESMRAIARNMGRAHGSIRTWVLANAGRRPRPPGSSELRLSLAEREDQAGLFSAFVAAADRYARAGRRQQAA